MAESFATMSTPTEHGAVVINGIPAIGFTKRRKECRAPYYTGNPASEHAPYIAHRGDVAMLSPDVGDRDNHESLVPFFTSFNGVPEESLNTQLALIHPRFVGIVVTDTPDDMSSDWQPTAATLQVGGIATIRHTGDMPIRVGDIVAIRRPARTGPDMWHVVNPGINEGARGVVKAITYPLSPKDVSIAGVAAAAAKIRTAPQLGQRAIDTLLSSFAEDAAARAALAGFIVPFIAGISLASIIGNMPGESSADALGFTREIMQLFDAPTHSDQRVQFGTATQSSAAKQTILELVRYLMFPNAALELPAGVNPGEEMMLEIRAMKRTTECTLTLLSQAIAQHGIDINASIIGRAVKPANRGEAFDVQIGNYMI